MKASLKEGFVGGLIGALAVAGVLSLLALLGAIPKAPFVAAYQSTFGSSWVAGAIVGGVLFILIGALWALPFALLVPNPTILKGILYGFVPTLWAWTFVPGVMTGEPLFGGFTAKGLLVPIVMNCLIWGSLVGWYCQRHTTTRPAVS